MQTPHVCEIKKHFQPCQTLVSTSKSVAMDTYTAAKNHLISKKNSVCLSPKAFGQSDRTKACSSLEPKGGSIYRLDCIALSVH